MYNGVPIIAPVRVRPGVASPISLIFAMPKSMSFGVNPPPVFTRKIFSGFRSR